MFPSLLAALSLTGIAVDAGPSYLFLMNPDKTLTSKRYVPQAGDIVLFDDHDAEQARRYRRCGTDGPLHAGIVIRREDGSFATLEAGVKGVLKVFLVDLHTRLREYDGTVLVRRLRTPLNGDQSKQLADFAAAQEGKPYAIGRLAMQTIPVRLKSAQYARTFGKTSLDRDRWFCSELVVAAAVSAGIWDIDRFPANMMYPRDLCYDENFDLSPFHESPALWYPRPQLDRIGDGVRVGTR